MPCYTKCTRTASTLEKTKGGIKMREYGYEIRETRKSAYGLKKILIAATAFLCTVGITVTTLVFLTMMSASGSLKKAPEINITSCPEFVTDENVTANIKGIIYDSDSSCTLYINGERVVSTSNAGEKLEWEREYMVFPDAVLQLNIEARDEDGNCISKTKTITRIKTDNTKANETAEYIEKDPWHADTTEIAPYPVYEIGTSLVKNTKDPKSNVRIRKGADINSRQIDTLDAGESVTYLGVCANGWYYIQMNNGEKGYISAEYVEVQ